MKRKQSEDPAFEDSLSHDWSRDLTIAEVSIGNRPLLYLGIAIFCVLFTVAVRIVYLNWSDGAYYQARAVENMAQYKETPAPRGTIYDRQGNILAESKAAFAAVLNTREFIKNESLRADTIRTAQDILNITPDDLAALVNQAGAQDFATPVVLAENLTPAQLVNLKALKLTTINVVSDFTRDYPQGAIFGSAVGYTGRVSQSDLKTDHTLTGSDFIGKTGVESFYDSTLRGKPGITVQYKDALGNVLREEQQSTPAIGTPVNLSIDGGFQNYFYTRFASGLRSLGKKIGLGLAMDPRTGEVLSLINLPGFDPNLFSKNSSTTKDELQQLFTSTDKPLFDRAINGFYSPGSTIKPFMGVAALKDGVIDPNRIVYSNGYLLVPNPYNSSTPSKYLDWRYQGDVNLYSALAQSSDVYFYLVGGGSPPVSTPLLNDQTDYGIKGIGINRLSEWWKAFGFGKPTGIDMPNESVGFLKPNAFHHSLKRLMPIPLMP